MSVLLLECFGSCFSFSFGFSLGRQLVTTQVVCHPLHFALFSVVSTEQFQMLISKYIQGEIVPFIIVTLQVISIGFGRNRPLQQGIPVSFVHQSIVCKATLPLYVLIFFRAKVEFRKVLGHLHNHLGTYDPREHENRLEVQYELAFQQQTCSRSRAPSKVEKHRAKVSSLRTWDQVCFFVFSTTMFQQSTL